MVAMVVCAVLRVRAHPFLPLPPTYIHTSSLLTCSRGWKIGFTERILSFHPLSFPKPPLAVFSCFPFLTNKLLYRLTYMKSVDN